MEKEERMHEAKFISIDTSISFVYQKEIIVPLKVVLVSLSDCLLGMTYVQILDIMHS